MLSNRVVIRVQWAEMSGGNSTAKLYTRASRDTERINSTLTPGGEGSNPTIFHTTSIDQSKMAGFTIVITYESSLEKRGSSKSMIPPRPSKSLKTYAEVSN